MNNIVQQILVPIIAVLIATAGVAQAQSISAVRTINFSGYEWTVKSSDTITGPGNNYFSNSTESVWVDEQDQLHLKMIKRNGTWYSAEVNTTKSLGYGEYFFFVASRIDRLNKNVVTGLITWDDSPQYNHREIDLEFSRWGDQNNSNSQYVIQPHYYPGNIKRFNMQLDGNYTTHSFVWKNNSLSFQSLHGHYYSPPNPSYIIQSWNYTGDDNPLSGNETVHINLWLFDANRDGIGDFPSDGNETELIIKRFEFIPVAPPVSNTTPPASITNLMNVSYAPTYINWTWRDPSDLDFSYVKIYIDGKFKTNVAKGKKFYNATGFLPNTTHSISTRTVDTSGNANLTWVNHTARTTRDYTPPASVTNLTNRTYSRKYIKWTWKDPSTYDFTKVMIYINGIFKTNVTKGKQYYNATVLKNNTYYKISIRTVDTSNNVNKTWVNHTARTAP